MWKYKIWKRLKQFLRGLDMLVNGQNTILNQLEALTVTLDDLKAKVQANHDLAQSAITLINGLAQLIRDNKNDPAKLQEIADQLDADDAAMGKAITDNTPSGPPLTSGKPPAPPGSAPQSGKKKP